MMNPATQKSFKERFATIRTLEKKDLVPQASGIDIKNAGKNSFFTYLGKTYFVKDLNKYEETSEDFKTQKGYFIHELTCLCLDTGKVVNFEWEFDDELEISMTLDRLSFRDLKDDEGEGIDGDDLDPIAEQKDVIMIKDEKFWYEDDWAALYYRGKKEETVYMYEFENGDHTKFLTIEEWSGSGKDQYQIYTSAPVDPHAVDLVSKGDA